MMSAQLWQWALILGFFGFIMPGVNNWAHAGGFAGGWDRRSAPGVERREPGEYRYHRRGAAADRIDGGRHCALVRERDRRPSRSAVDPRSAIIHHLRLTTLDRGLSPATSRPPPPPFDDRLVGSPCRHERLPPIE